MGRRRRRVETLKDIDHNGHNLRVFCYCCERTVVMDSIIWVVFQQKGWPIDIASARKRFRCRLCKTSDDVLLVAARRTPELSWERQVHQWFFANRSKRLFRPD